MHKIFFYTVLYTVDGCSSEKKSHSKQPVYSGSIPIHARHPIWGGNAGSTHFDRNTMYRDEGKKKKIETYASQYSTKKKEEKK